MGGERSLFNSYLITTSQQNRDKKNPKVILHLRGATFSLVSQIPHPSQAVLIS